MDYFVLEDLATRTDNLLLRDYGFDQCFTLHKLCKAAL